MPVHAWDKGFDFRSTLAANIDPPSHILVNTQLFPTSNNGVRFGWDVAPTAGDRTGELIPILGGTAEAASNTAKNFRVELPEPGAYAIDIAMGDAQFTNGLTFAILDDTTVLFSTTQNTANGGWLDMHNSYGAVANNADATTQYTQILWIQKHLPATFNFKSNMLTVRIGSTTSAQNCDMAYLRVQKIFNHSILGFGRV